MPSGDIMLINGFSLIIAKLACSKAEVYISKENI